MDLPKTRAEAREKECKYYFTGKPCTYGHLSVRYTSSALCKECRDSYNKNYYKENREAMRQSNREWLFNNKDKRKEQERRRYENNKEYFYEANAIRRSNKIRATPQWIDRREVRYIYKLASEKGLVVDHIVPLISDYVCGLHCAENLRCIPKELNAFKGNRYWPDMP